MRTSSNPAFRNLPQSGGYAGFDHYHGASATGYAPPPPSAATRPMTVDDVVTKTAITLVVAVIAGVFTAVTKQYWLALPGLLVGLGIGLYLSFRPKPSPGLVLTYAVAEGLLMGAVSALFELKWPGIVLQAMIGTVGVFAGMLVIYKTGAIRVTPRLTRWIVGALIGVVALMLVNLVAGFFVQGGLGLRDGGPLAIIFSLVVIGVAAFSFLLDFDAADQMIRQGVEAKWAWYIAFGLLMTLVWLYLEILRLISYFRED